MKRTLPGLVLLALAGCLRAPAPDAATAPDLRAVYSVAPADWPAPEVDAGVEWRELGLVPPVAHPAENPWSEAKEELGRLLFHDGRLSGSGQMSCASCHAPELGWTDGRTTSIGHGALPVRRNAPTVKNSGFASALFRDGRAGSLEELVLAVFHNPAEMRIDEAALLAGLASSSEYTARFEEAFGDPEPTLDRVARAIACFCRTITSDGSSAFDAFLRGDAGALSDAELRGLHLFRTRARCMNCHHGPLLTDDGFHDLGLSYYGRELEDLGRHAVTGLAEDVGRFRTPSLRDVARTAPYMHNGLFDLDGVLNMYAKGMATLRRKPGQEDDPLFPTKSPLLRALDLSGAERADLRAFLEALTERRRRVRVELPGSGDRASTGRALRTPEEELRESSAADPRAPGSDATGRRSLR